MSEPTPKPKCVAVKNVFGYSLPINLASGPDCLSDDHATEDDALSAACYEAPQRCQHHTYLPEQPVAETPKMWTRDDLLADFAPISDPPEKIIEDIREFCRTIRASTDVDVMIGVVHAEALLRIIDAASKLAEAPLQPLPLPPEQLTDLLANARPDSQRIIDLEERVNLIAQKVGLMPASEPKEKR